MNFPLLGYIANLTHLREEHRDYAKELNDFGYPTLISNDVNNSKEYPHCEREQAAAVAKLRLQSILNARTTYFIYFIEQSTNNNIANWELGIAVAVKIPTIAVIGEKLKSSHQLIECVTHYDCWENFIFRHFKF